MTELALVAYIPVLHEGYRRFLEGNGQGRRLFLIGPELYADYRPLAKDVRALAAYDVAPALEAWRICSEIQVLDVEGARQLEAEKPSLILPDEDISYQVVERHFPRLEVRFDTHFLRWDKTKTVKMLKPGAARAASDLEALADVVDAAEDEAAKSIDWWRQVGAAIRFADGTIASAGNEHLPHPLSPYAVGDPRSNFFKGVHLELSTAMHAEARLIADAAADGRSTRGAVMYITDFPCPPCAKLVAVAGVTRLYFRTGYAILDGEDVLRAADIEVIQIA
jgi:dCMP deaminase